MDRVGRQQPTRTFMPMRRRLLPSVSALAAFESAARHSSISAAAAELHLSQSAVSRLVRQVEDALEVKLFERVRQRIVLTEPGRVYAQYVYEMLDNLEQTTFRVMGYGTTGGTLSLGVFPTLAIKWLLPRLPDFKSAHPEVTVNCFVRSEQFDFEDDPLDAAIHFGEPIWPDTVVVPLFSEVLVPVASPDMPGVSAIQSAADIASLPLLHEVTRPTAWRDWFAGQGIEQPGLVQGARFDQFGLIGAAAQAGLGVGLIPRFLVEDELQAGHLKVLLDSPLESSGGYYLVYPHRNAGVKVIEAFRDWLVAEARKQPPMVS